MDVETLVFHAATLSRDDQLEIVARLQDRLFADTESAGEDELLAALEDRFAEDGNAFDTEPNQPPIVPRATVAARK